MRSFLGLVVSLICLLALPGIARADGLCNVAGDVAFQQRLLPVLRQVADDPAPEAHAALHRALGAQYAGVWLDNPRQGWSVAFAPGPLDAAGVRQAIRDLAATRVGADDAAYLDSLLALVPVPYSEADLQPVMDAITGLRVPELSSWGIGCTFSDAFRVEVGVADPETPELKARIDALLAPFGDKVVARYGTGRVTAATGVAGPLVTSETIQSAVRALRVGDYVLLPRASRCVHGRTVGAKARNATVTLRAGARKATATAGRRATLRLMRRTTRIAVTVTLRDGRTATQTLTYRRC